MNPAFAIGQQVGTNFGKAFERVSDENAIDSILSQAMQSNDPNQLRNNIGQILSKVSPERQPMAINFIENRIKNIAAQEDAKNKQLAAERGGYDPYAPSAVQKSQYEFGQASKQFGDIVGNQPAQPAQDGQSASIAWNQLEDEQLVKLTGVKGFSRQAEAEMKRRQEEKKAAQSSFEPESEKLEAKRVAEFATEIENEYKAAQAEEMRLNRMATIDKEGNVSTPALLKVLDSSGLPIGILGNPATEEYRKLEADFTRDVSKVFPGGRITNYEIQTYLRTIPSLMNSSEGRKNIIRNRKLMNEAKKVRYDEYKKIIKENNGKKPQNLGILIDERTADKMQKIEDEFVNGIQSEVEKFQVPIRMVDPQGNPVNIPPNEIERALKAGAKFV